MDDTWTVGATCGDLGDLGAISARSRRDLGAISARSRRDLGVFTSLPSLTAFAFCSSRSVSLEMRSDICIVIMMNYEHE